MNAIHAKYTHKHTRARIHKTHVLAHTLLVSKGYKTRGWVRGLRACGKRKVGVRRRGGKGNKIDLSVNQPIHLYSAYEYPCIYNHVLACGDVEMITPS